MKGARAERRVLSSVDGLALIRTRLANERTFLAYLRTFVGSFVAGVGLIEFFGNLFSLYTGIALIAVAPVILVVGIVRVIRTKGAIEQAYRSVDKPQRQEAPEERKDSEGS